MFVVFADCTKITLYYIRERSETIILLKMIAQLSRLSDSHLELRRE